MKENLFEFNHVTLGVSDMNRSVDFYKKFGFSLEKEFETYDMKIVWMKLNGIILEMFWYKKHNELPNHSKTLNEDLMTVGNKHFGLGVKSIEEAIKFIKENNLCDDEITITEGRMGKRYFFIKDPDGILFEIIEEK